VSFRVQKQHAEAPLYSVHQAKSMNVNHGPIVQWVPSEYDKSECVFMLVFRQISLPCTINSVRKE
jgi:hypothetical protein